VITYFAPLAIPGRLGESDEVLRQAIELSRQHGEFGLLSVSLGFRVIHDMWTGETETTLASARKSVEVAERVGVSVLLPFALVSLGNALRLEQRYPEAFEAYREALSLMRAKRVGLNWRSDALSGQALVYSALGEHEKAIAQARAALEESVRGGNPVEENFARTTLARVLLAQDDPALCEEVEGIVERAEALCEETGIRMQLPPLLEVRAALAEHRGDPQEARRRLCEAHRLYTEIGATGHAKRLATELGL
jgi:tetratricopeptide (TPR) repeat protein